MSPRSKAIFRSSTMGKKSKSKAVKAAKAGVGDGSSGGADGAMVAISNIQRVKVLKCSGQLFYMIGFRGRPHLMPNSILCKKINLRLASANFFEHLVNVCLSAICEKDWT